MRARRRLLACALLCVAIATTLAIAVAGERSARLPAAHAAAGASAAHPLIAPSALPTPALGPVSAVLGAANASYRVERSHGGFRASNPAQSLGIRFSSSGVQLSGHGLGVGLSLRAAGYGSALQGVGAAALHVRGNRVLYQRGGVEESYANGPAGLEQAFTLTRALPGSRQGALTLAMTLSGSARASLDATGQSVELAGAVGSSLRYGALLATDASGRALHSWLQLDGRELLIRVDTTGARYPLRIDPLIDGSSLSPTPGGEGELFGYSVALSADGNTAIVGDRYGAAAWVFTRSGSTWEQQGPQLMIDEEGAGSGEACGEEAAECGFGHSVALSADGNTAAVGAPSDHSERGAAWVFTRTGSEWSTHGVELNGGEAQGGRFGADVALSADGNTALVGAPGSHREQGSAWVFTRAGSSWTQPGRELTGGPEASGAGGFGGSVALSADGGTALIGARFDARVGAAWVFTLADSTWKQQGAKLTGGGEVGVGRFGGSVALSAFGDTALIGGPTDAEGAGAAWVFTRAGSSWEQQGAKLTADDELGEGHFGSSLALSGDGQVALIGAPRDDVAGAVRVFARAGANWEQQEPTLASPSEPTAKARFGASVALSSAGAAALIGGPATRKSAGAAWTYLNTTTPAPTVSSVGPSSGSTEGGTRVLVRGTGFLPGATVTIGVAPTSVEVISETELSVVTAAHAGGPEEVAVTTADGGSTGGPSYTYLPPPTVTSVNPVSGPSAGGTHVVVTGTDFLAGSKLEIGDELAVEVISETELKAVTRPNAPGSDEVVVTTTAGESRGGPSYTYVPPPKVSSVSPVSGPTAGGTPVRVTGSNFGTGAKVQIGGVASAVEVISETELKAVTPAHGAGPQEVVVTTGNGGSSGGPFYTYVAPPKVSSIEPASGTSEGGTPVVVRGTGFTPETKLQIGAAAGAVEVVSETEMKAVTPAYGAGEQEVIASNGNGVSNGGATYTFVTPTVSLSLTGNPLAASGILASEVTNAPFPQAGVSGNVAPVTGAVLVQLPGSGTFVVLTGLRQVPFGTIIDATNGKVTVTTVGPHGELQSMTFYAGKFELVQGPHDQVIATLNGGRFHRCPTARERSHLARASSTHPSSKHVVRKLWAEGHGSYSTKGNYAAGAVVGTRWLTEDLCDGTLIRVATDSVEVTNLVTHHRRRVRAGHSYLAKAP
jgi:IPT/TIG domain/FG-GAP repeat